jgi:nitric oxide reductase NorD protein
MRSLSGARRLALKARYMMQRARAQARAKLARRPTTLPLERLQRRLELVLAAAYGRPIAVAALERGRFNRPFSGAWSIETPPRLDGETIRLPEALGIDGDEGLAAERYRLLAIEQAERLMRGTSRAAPQGDQLERDLYLLREGATIDAHIARTFPGLARVLREERLHALEQRPKYERLTATEQDVELLLREALTTSIEADVETSSDPEESLAWARETARRLRRDGDGYRGIPLATAWGTTPENAGHDDLAPTLSTMSGKTDKDTRDDAPRDESEQESDNHGDDPGPMPTLPSKQGREYESKVDTSEETTPVYDAAPSDSPEGIQSQTDSSSDQGDPDALPTEHLPPAIYYDEWNADRDCYVRNGSAVRLYDAVGADPSWLRQELIDHAATVRQIRTQFERLRARRTLLPRQQRGDALDLAACVDAAIDRKLGNSPDDRLYLDARPARRGLAITLLIDASGSTEQRVTPDRRIIDLEKITLVLATQALDALGDLYAIYAFAGRHASNVKVTVIKDFNESNGDAVTRRIAALTPGGFTRLGAAVRHATHQLARQTAGHRLLLLLSDGRPNDLDAYQGPYGVEDARRAILEARASGVYPFCLTIDQAASEYLPRIFGNAGHTILQKPEQLPRALIAVVRGLIKR